MQHVATTQNGHFVRGAWIQDDPAHSSDDAETSRYDLKPISVDRASLINLVGSVRHQTTLVDKVVETLDDQVALNEAICDRLVLVDAQVEEVAEEIAELKRRGKIRDAVCGAVYVCALLLFIVMLAIGMWTALMG